MFKDDKMSAKINFILSLSALVCVVLMFEFDLAKKAESVSNVKIEESTSSAEVNETKVSAEISKPNDTKTILLFGATGLPNSYNTAKELAEYLICTEEELGRMDFVSSFIPASKSSNNMATLGFVYKFNPESRVLRNVYVDHLNFNTNGLDVYTMVTESKFDSVMNVIVTNKNFYETSEKYQEGDSTLYDLYEIRAEEDSTLLGYYAKKV